MDVVFFMNSLEHNERQHDKERISRILKKILLRNGWTDIYARDTKVSYLMANEFGAFYSPLGTAMSLTDPGNIVSLDPLLLQNILENINNAVREVDEEIMLENVVRNYENEVDEVYWSCENFGML